MLLGLDLHVPSIQGVYRLCMCGGQVLRGCWGALSGLPGQPWVKVTQPTTCREEWTTAIQTVADGLKRQEEELMEFRSGSPSDNSGAEEMEVSLAKPKHRVVRLSPCCGFQGPCPASWVWSGSGGHGGSLESLLTL